MKRALCLAADLLVVLLMTNLTVLVRIFAVPLFPTVLLYLLCFTGYVTVNILPAQVKSPEQRLRIMVNGGNLLAVCVISFALNLVLQFIWCICFFDRIGWIACVVNILLVFLFTAVLLLNGMVRVCTTSVQLGIKWRLLFIFCWWVPIFGLFLFYKICSIVQEEFAFETEKLQYNSIRQTSALCATKYPLLLVHGVFFRDRKLFNYWGRIPAELMKNGAVIYYGQQESAASVADSAEELALRIRQVVAQTGCQKVNIIAHSKGGLDARYAISRCGVGHLVASLTTINTPHHGCAFADYLLKKAPKALVDRVARSYNAALKMTGDRRPDFKRAVSGLTVEACNRINLEAPDMPGILYQSVMSKMSRFTSAPFPLCASYLLVRHFSAANDGLVDVKSARWGSTYRLLSPPGGRGISHGDMIDLYRKNLRGFDVREFYVGLVRELKQAGL